MQENNEEMAEAVEPMEPEMPETPKKKTNGVVRVLRILAIAIYTFGGVLGLYALVQTAMQAGFLGGLVTALSTCVSYAIYGSLLLGFSELLRQLERIADK